MSSRFDSRGGWTRRSILRAAGLGGLGAVGGGLLAACGSDEEGSGGAASGPLLMGEILTLTGPLAGSIQPTYAGLDIALKEINDAGGIAGRTFELKRGDDQYTPTREPVLLREMEAEDINVIFGPTGSSNVQAILPVATPKKIITAGWAKTDSQGDAAQWPYNFPLTYTSTTEGTLLARQALDWGSKSFGVLAEQTEFGNTLTAAAQAEFGKDGVQITKVTQFPLTAPSMTGYVEQLRNANVDAIGVFTVSSGALGGILKTLNDMQWYPALVGLIGPWTKANLDLMPAQMADRVFADNYKTLSYTDTEPISNEVKAFAEKVLADPQGKNSPVGAVTAPFYDFAFFLKEAIEKTGSADSDKLKQYLETNEYDGVLGTYKLTPQRHNAFGIDAMAVISVASLKDPASMSGIFGKRVA
jgi:branched-chain amino acid transport system substrate-binding protein